MNIVITGASKGIGFELAKLFARDEKNSVIAIARSKDRLQELKNECIKQNHKSKLKAIVLDIEDLNDIKSKLVPEIKQYINSVDVLVNNAGYLVNKPFTHISIADIQKTYTTNVFSPAVVLQEIIPLLKESELKHVVNISSMGGFQGSSKFPGLSIYSSSKAALANLTECLAEEYKNDNIKFNSLALGAVNTEMLRNAFPGYNAPLQADEMAKFIYDFALNGYKYFNGKVLPVSVSTP